MTNQITLVSSPDDVLHDAVRLLLVDLNQEQTQAISEALMTVENIPATVIYVWSNIDPVEWLIDKKLKSQIIVFNADSEKSEIVGYLAAQQNSFYFGFLKNLEVLNKRAIYSSEDLKGIINHHFKKYETQQ
jgi:hypothetical protein